MSSEIIKLEVLQTRANDDVKGEEVTQDEENNSIFLMSDLDDGRVICDSGAEEDQNERNRDIEIPQSTDGAEAIYSCSSCGVSFFSVLEHIQQYHSDQEVVVEMENEPTVENNTMEEVALLQVFDEENQGVEEGEVQEEMMEVEEGRSEDDTTSLVDTRKNNSRSWKTLHEQECVDSDGRVYTRKVVQIERFWEPKDSDLKPESQEVAEEPEDRRVHLEEEVHIQDNGADPVISRVYHCVRCSTQYDSLEQFDVHSCSIGSTVIPKYKCLHCDVTYNSSKSLCAHMKVHKGKKKPIPRKSSDNASYRCDICDTLFPSNKSLRLHARMHDPIKQRPIEAPVEYKPSSKRQMKDDPFDNSGSSGDKFHCEACNKWMHIGYKKVHELTFHAGLEQYNCEICNRKFFTEENLEMHLTVHNSDKVVVNKSDRPLPYECSYCSRQFSRPHEKVKHERIHTGERPHVCEICGKSFRVSYCLTLHMRTHTGARPYQCTHCGKRFKAHSVYNHHVLTHSNIRAYKCPYCPKSFKTSVQLAGHKNAHTKPFSCTECNRPFASLYAVRVHMETHKRQNNLKFNCNLCGASYARAFALKDHIRSQHLDANPTALQKDSYIPEVAAATLAIIPKEDGDSIEVVEVAVIDENAEEDMKTNILQES